MTELYKKNKDGSFSVVDSSKARAEPDLQQGIIVYDPSSEMAPQWLIQVDDEIRLYSLRRMQNQYSLVQDSYQKYNEATKSWEKSNIASSLRSPSLQALLQSLIPLSEEEQTTLRQYHYAPLFTQQLKDNIQSELDKLKSLRAVPDVHPQERQSVRDKIAKQYTQYVIDQLATLIQDFSLEKCEQFLKNHWEQIQGTVLCYTALPDHPATLVLCSIAQKLADHKNALGFEQKEKHSAIDFLMPDVFAESQFSDSFPNLNEIDIRKILKTHILSEHHRYLLPVKLFVQSLPAPLARDEHGDDGAAAPAAAASDNAYPNITIDSDFAKILNPYWSYDHKDANHQAIPEFLSPGELQRLALHNSCTKVLLDSKKQYDEIKQDQSTLLGKLNRLIQELQGASSHGGRGQAAVAAIGAFPAITAFNSYYDTLTPEQKDKIPKEVKDLIEKLKNLASEKQTDYTIKSTPETPSNITPGVIYITKKADQFYYSIQTHKGDTIKEVLLELDTLPSNTPLDKIKQYKDDILTYLALQKHIPESKRFFVSQAELIETCIGSQSSSLKSIVSRHDSKLSGISLSAESKKTTLDRIKNQYSANQTQLERDRLGNSYDHFGISKKIIDLLQLPIDKLISNDETLKEFMLLEPDELNALLQKPEIQAQILRVVGSFENWVMFITENDPNKTQLVLHALAERFCNSENGVIKNHTDFSQLLGPLLPDRCKAVCEALKDQLPGRIKNGYDFGQALQYLSEAQCKAVCDALKDQLPGIIKSVDDFRNALQYLPEEQRTVVIEALRPILPNIIQRAENVLHLMDFKDWQNPIQEQERFLNEAQCKAICDALKDKLRDIIKSVSDINILLIHLQGAQIKVVLEALRPILPNIIKTSENFERVMDKLWRFHRPPNKNDPHNEKVLLEIVFDACKDKLPEIIQNYKDFQEVRSCLYEEQRTYVFEKLKDKLLSILICKSSSAYNKENVFEEIKFTNAESITFLNECLLNAEKCSFWSNADSHKPNDYDPDPSAHLTIYSSKENGSLTIKHSTFLSLYDRGSFIGDDKIKTLIRTLHEKFYALFNNPKNPQKPLTPQQEKNFNDNRSAVLKFIKVVILKLLSHVKPENMDEDTFKKAEQILSLHSNMPDFSFFGLRGATASLSDKAYTKHKEHFDQLAQQNAQPKKP